MHMNLKLYQVSMEIAEILRFGQDQTAVILRAAIRHQPIPPCAACLKVFFGARLFS